MDQSIFKSRCYDYVCLFPFPHLWPLTISASCLWQQSGDVYHVESLNRSVQLHVSGFLPSDCYEQMIKGSKGSCVGCRWHKTSFWAKYIITVESYEISKIFLLSRWRKSLNRSKIACTQAAGEMHACASLIWSADVGTNRAVHADQFDLFSDFFGRFSDSTWYIFCTVYVKLNFYSILCEKQMIFFPQIFLTSQKTVTKK